MLTVSYHRPHGETRDISGRLRLGTRLLSRHLGLTKYAFNLNDQDEESSVKCDIVVDPELLSISYVHDIPNGVQSKAGALYTYLHQSL